MKNFKKFPSKELALKLFAVFALLISFKFFFQHLNLNSKKIKNHYLMVKKSEIQNNQLMVKKSEIQNNQEIKLLVVEKLNTYIEEQRFLLTMLEDDNPASNSLIRDIEKTLNEIEKEATEKQVQNLINTPQIEELRNNLAAYKQVFTKQKG